MSGTLPPNLMQAVAGSYTLNLKAMFQEAWWKINGVKKPFWGAFLWGVLILAGIGLIQGVAVEILALANFLTSAKIFDVASNIIVRIASLLFFTNLIYLMINHIVGRPIRARMIFKFEGAMSKLFGVTCIYLILIFLLFLPAIGINSLYESHVNPFFIALAIFVSIIMFIYIQVIGCMMLLLVREKNLDVLTAAKVVFQAVTKQLLQNILIYAAISIFVVASVILTIGIGAIWVLPMQTNFMAIWYRQIFGIEVNV